jgi:AcrR family transcriptional regulator
MVFDTTGMATTTAPRRRQGLPRAEQVARNRAELLAAARRVFRGLGYAGASLDAIAEAAGFSKGAVYSHFASKADLFLSLLESRIEERAEGQRQSLAQRGTVRSFIGQVFATSRADPEWRLAVLEFRVVAARDPELQARYRKVHERTVAGIADALGTLVASKGIESALPLDVLAVGGLICDVGAFLEELAMPGVVGDELPTALFARLIGAPEEEDGR